MSSEIAADAEKKGAPVYDERADVFGDEDGHQIHYKTLSWQFVALLMIAEIVSNGMLSLPAALAAVGLVPGVILLVFLGVFAGPRQLRTAFVTPVVPFEGARTKVELDNGSINFDPYAVCGREATQSSVSRRCRNFRHPGNTSGSSLPSDIVPFQPAFGGVERTNVGWSCRGPVFALFTAKLLVDFKLNHPEVHNMGDAGYILFGRLGREVLSLGTILFAIAATGSELLSGQQALQVLSNDGLCSISLVAIFAAATFLLALPRTLDGLSWLSLVSVLLIIVAGLVTIVGAGVNQVEGRVVDAVVTQNFYNAFLAITNPVFAYAGHFMFFILISEMRRPQDAMKAAWTLQTFSTAFYVLFSVLVYVYIGSTVASPAPFSLTPTWSKAAFGIGLGNFLLAGSLYAHTAAKLVFVRLFRGERHLHEHTVVGWVVWTGLVGTAVGVAFVFSVAVPIFSYLIGITAAVFASWYTYGLAGFFWLHDAYYLDGRGREALRRRWGMTVLSLLTIIAGAFICVAGTYVSIKLIVDAYRDGLVGKPFTC